METRKGLQKRRVAVVGAGPAGCAAAYFLQRHSEADEPKNLFDVTLFDCAEPLKTLLPTGGGRCNLAHAQYDFKELAKNYPRGEKFLYSVFSQFSTADTLDFFRELGVETYTQDDNRIFPASNSAKDVREKFLKALGKCKFVKKRVTRLDELDLHPLTPTSQAGILNPCLRHSPKGRGDSGFDYIIIAVGGHSGYELARQIGHTIIEPRPALTGLRTKEDFSALAGVSINDLLFTHEGVSGPAVYKISSLRAREEFPYKITIDLCGEVDLQAMLDANPHKTLKNLLSEILPKSLAAYIAGEFAEIKCHKIDGRTRDMILQTLHNFEITAIGAGKSGEVVTSGGVCLDEVDAKTMRSKLMPNLYFCGEVLDIDGFCGGFNLQNCWSTAFVAVQEIVKYCKHRRLNE
jgi:predicted Rossmann fold flavoprotein